MTELQAPPKDTKTRDSLEQDVKVLNDQANVMLKIIKLTEKLADPVLAMEVCELTLPKLQAVQKKRVEVGKELWDYVNG